MIRTLSLVVLVLFLSVNLECYGADKSSSDLLKQGLLGAGSGVVGGLASGGKGRDVWKGALAGAGVNIVGGALLDSISGEHVDRSDSVQTMDSTNAYSQGYNEGYNNGYKQGYTQGYREGANKDTR
ncbi:MAG: hypothetical protein ABID09_05695 [Candidatus Omnitrophota bacterium]